jgi:O-antigen ligase
MVSIAIPFTFSAFNFQKFQQSFTAISVAASVFSIVNFLPLANSLINPSRYQGYLKGAATFAVVLGGLLPFMFWGLLKVQSGIIKIICLAGFICGFITLAFTGQRTGTIAGFISLIPLILMTLVNRRTFKWFILLIISLSILSSFFIKQTSLERINFLLFRYSASSGLSYREMIWREAFAEIAQSPYIGRGIGGAETVITSSFHNAYLEVWFNTGWLGLTCFLLSQLYFLLRALYLSLFVKNHELKPILAVSIGFLLSFMLMGLVESTGATASSVNLILFLFVGVFISSSDGLGFVKPSRASEKMPISPKLLVGSLEKNLS